MAKRKQTRRQEYNKAVKLLARRIKRLAETYQITKIDIQIKPEGRVTKKDVEYINSLKRDKLKEAVKTVDVGTGKDISIKEYQRAERAAINFAKATIDGWKKRVKELGGKFSDKLIDVMDSAISKMGEQDVSTVLFKLEEKGYSLDYAVLNYEALFNAYTTALLQTIDALGGYTMTRQQLEEEFNLFFYEVPEEYEEG